MSIYKRYNWIEIQEYYDEGHSIMDISKKFNISKTGVNKAVKRGDLKTRTLSEAMLLFFKNNRILSMT